MIALSLDRDEAGILAALTAGAALGFLYHNFHPASIFMGDAGSNLLGLLLACIAIQGVLKTAAVVALFFPLVILAVPILDTGFVVAKRLKYRKPVYSADTEHFHHRFGPDRLLAAADGALPVRVDAVAGRRSALALRFVPYSDDTATSNLGWSRGDRRPSAWSRSRRRSTWSTRSRSSSSAASASASCASARRRWSTAPPERGAARRTDRTRDRDRRVRGRSPGLIDSPTFDPDGRSVNACAQLPTCA